MNTAQHLQVIVDGNVDEPLPPHAALNLLEVVDWKGIHELLSYIWQMWLGLPVKHVVP
jgi:hypothetical protein